MGGKRRKVNDWTSGAPANPLAIGVGDHPAPAGLRMSLIGGTPPRRLPRAGACPGESRGP